MNPSTISTDLSVSPQITPDDIAALKAQGFRAIICNRPDGEGADQPSFVEIANAARSAGIEARYIPVIADKLRDEDVAAFAAALAVLPGPVLAYCRSGTRSATLWSLSQAGVKSLPEILAATKAAGFDMTDVLRRIANGR